MTTGQGIAVAGIWLGAAAMLYVVPFAFFMILPFAAVATMFASDHHD